LIAVDTNILVYAHRRDSPWNLDAKERLRDLSEGIGTWCIPWTCIHEFYGVVTHPRVFIPPSTVTEALDQIALWMASPTLSILSEGPTYWPALQTTLINANITGPRVHDARIAALCLQHGVTTLWSADRDFSRFGRLKVVNPIVRKR
jgi:toxin-antitoxin system PIN domain toxin